MCSSDLKAYSTQLIASYALAVQFGKVREQITEEKYQELIAELKTLPDKIAKIIEDDKERIQWFAAKQANARDAFFIGRGIDCLLSPRDARRARRRGRTRKGPNLSD